MSSPSHEGWSDAVASYALGALPDDERAELERHLETCETCREEVASLQSTVDVLPVAVPPVAAPKELKARIMRVVESEAELLQAAGSGADRPPRRRRGWRGWFPRPLITVGAATAALAVGVIAGSAIVGGGGSSGQRTIAARVTDPGAVGTARAAVLVKGDRATLRVHGMPAPESGRVWQVWLKRTGTPAQPAGALFMLRSGDVAIPRRVQRGDTVMVTSEPAGGSRSPTRPAAIVAEPV